MGKLRITQNKSVIKANSRQKKTIQALGLKNPHDSIEIQDNPAIWGMVEKVKHLVTVEKF